MNPVAKRAKPKKPPPASHDVRRAIRNSLMASIPFIVGMVPFGLVTGITAAEAGLSVGAAMVSSAMIFAGSSQIAAFTLMREDAAVGVMLLTIMVVNMRMMFYSAGIAHYWRAIPRAWRLMMAFFLTDQAFANAWRVYRARRLSPRARIATYVPFALCIYANWIISTGIGAYAGATLPAEWELTFSLSLVFLTVLMPTLYEPYKIYSAITAALAFLFLHNLPHHLGLVVSIVLAVIVGGSVEWWRTKPGAAPGAVKGGNKAAP